MQPEALGGLIERIFTERTRFASIFDIPAGAFYVPPFTSSQFTVLSETCALPVGPAAGPHTHLAQSILSGWLTGGRVFELKTVQVLDELDIDKPCIDAADEGYNTEWSTELRIEEAIEEYTKAWILLHLVSVLECGHPEHGSIFTMSVGYDLAGITSERVDRFIDTLSGRAENPALDRLREEARAALLAPAGPAGVGVERSTEARRRAAEALDYIPRAMCRSVALSTMHGCPPEEIEAIGLHLIEAKGLDTVVKLNPTLLGLDDVQRILDENGYAYGLDAASFAQDLQYPRALELAALLRGRASAAGRRFGVKLSNTLPVANERGRLPGDTEYVSGKALLPLTVSLAARLLGDLETPLPVSYSAGANADNIGELLGCGLAPVTVSTELLKPGGYQRLADTARAAAAALAGTDAGTELTPDAGRLSELSTDVSGRHDMRARRGPITARVDRALPVTDCFVAPCVEACPLSQDVPGYIRATATGGSQEALHCILETNPFPSLTAALCDQRCAKACTRIEYEGPVQIRKMKGIAVRRAEEAAADRVGGAADGAAAAQGATAGSAGVPPADADGGASGPTAEAVLALEPGIQGMSAAYFHARAGRPVTVPEPRATVEARIASELADYRVPVGAIGADLERIAAAGVRFNDETAPAGRRTGHSRAAAAETVIRQPAPQARPRIVELIAAGKHMVPDVPDTERATRRQTAAAAHSNEIRLKAGSRIGPGRGTDAGIAEVELSRCLECDAVCLKCVQVCPNRANTAVEMRPEDGLRDRYQVVHIDAWCNDCGNCGTFCPYGARPYREKLTIFSSAAGLEASPAPGLLVEGEEILIRPGFGGTVQRIDRKDLARETLDDDPGGSLATLVRRILADYPHLLPRGS
jgi:putative selenate reductase